MSFFPHIRKTNLKKKKHYGMNNKDYYIINFRTCKKKEQETQYEQQKLNSEGTRRAINLLMGSNSLSNSFSM